MSEAPATPSRRQTALAALILIALTALAAALIVWTEPEPEREAAVKRTAMLVEVLTAEVGEHTPWIPALGAARAAEDVSLQPRVSGQVAAIAPAFTPGSVVESGEVLIELDRADAANAVALAESALALALADLELELGRQAVARAEREHITDPISPEQERLVLREPQLSAARADVEAARARLRQAELDLGRTRVRAPSRSLVLSRAAGVGSLVGPGTALGRLVAVDRFWVELTLPARLLPHLPEGAAARVRDPTAWPDGAWREGQLSGVVRALDERTRLARLLITVADPLGLDSAEPALSVGAFVEAELQAATLRGAVRLPRDLVRRDGVVWTMEDDALRIRPVEVALEDAEYAYIASGLEAGAQVVVTDLATVKEGAPLRTEAGP